MARLGRVSMRTSLVLCGAALVGLLAAQAGMAAAEANSTSAPNTTCLAGSVLPDPLVCKEGGEGLLLPAFTSEWEWPLALRGFLYLIGLLWTFAGVAMFADSFMCAIEVVTAREVVVTDKDTGAQDFVKVWNPTVANLTLMALGSSAPEILLSIIEITGNKMMAGPLGPSTIVGSAAFNLFVILAVCSTALVQYKRVDRFGVYLVTVVAAMFAYLWLIIILIGWTPNVITIEEALITAAFFPILVVVAYGVDAGKLNFCGLIDKGKADNARSAEEHRIVNVQRAQKGKRVTLGTLSQDTAEKHEDLAALLQELNQTPGVAKDMYTEETVLTEVEKRALFEHMKEKKKLQGQSRAAYRVATTRKFLGKTDIEESSKGRLSTVALDMSSIEWDDSQACVPPKPGFDDDDDARGFVTFIRPTARVMEGGSTDAPRGEDGNAAGNVSVWLPVHRIGAGKNAGPLNFTWMTNAGTATAGKDFIAHSGEKLTFVPGETQKIIKVEIINDDDFELDEHFTVRLLDHEGEDNLELIEQVTVTIVNDDDVKSFADRVTQLLGFNQHQFKLGRDVWGEQFSDALTMPDDGLVGKVLWGIMLVWSLLNAVIPPTSIMGAWPSFLGALAMVGFTTALIGDLANLFGCVVGLEGQVTAITFVALGTSLPDTFASKTAALNEESADAAITNVTGSNAVNVFLGLGLSWSVASIYWVVNGPNEVWREQVPCDIQAEYPGGVFYQDAGSLAFSVSVFSVCSVVCFSILAVQRSKGGELGGPHRHVVGVLFILLWLTYVVLSSLNTYGHI